MIDHSTTTEEAAGAFGGNFGKGGRILYRCGHAAMYGKGYFLGRQYFGQHNVSFIEKSGEMGIAVYNNGRGRLDGEYSSVDLMIPERDEAGNFLQSEHGVYLPYEFSKSYVYPDSPEKMYSVFNGSAQILPNGNAFACPSLANFFVELNDEGEIVWEYVNPVGNDGYLEQGMEDDSTMYSFTAYRIPSYHPGLKGFDLASGAPIELNSIEWEQCKVSDDIEVFQPLVLYDPIFEVYYFNPDFSSDMQYEIFDLNGRTVMRGDNFGSFQIEALINNVYIIVWGEEGDKRIQKLLLQF